MSVCVLKENHMYFFLGSFPKFYYIRGILGIWIYFKEVMEFFVVVENLYPKSKQLVIFM